MKTLLGLLLCFTEPQVARCWMPTCDPIDAVTITERAPPPKRLGPALVGLSACIGELGDLARAAASLDRSKRAAMLGARAPAECRAGKFTDRASSIATACPMPSIVEPSSPALEHLDAGTYGFLVAISRELESSGEITASARRLLMTAVLAGALEGE